MEEQKRYLGEQFQIILHIIGIILCVCFLLISFFHVYGNDYPSAGPTFYEIVWILLFFLFYFLLISVIQVLIILKQYSKKLAILWYIGLCGIFITFIPYLDAIHSIFYHDNYNLLLIPYFFPIILLWIISLIGEKYNLFGLRNKRHKNTRCARLEEKNPSGKP